MWLCVWYDVAFYREDYRNIPLVNQGKRSHNICGARLDCGGEMPAAMVECSWREVQYERGSNRIWCWVFIWGKAMLVVGSSMFFVAKRQYHFWKRGEMMFSEANWKLLRRWRIDVFLDLLIWDFIHSFSNLFFCRYLTKAFIDIRRRFTL